MFIKKITENIRQKQNSFDEDTRYACLCHHLHIEGDLAEIHSPSINTTVESTAQFTCTIRITEM